jgi:ABC-type multidrug transport system fused ATPase/permease subunit
MSGRTSVTIAHRLSTAENADEVIVVDRGRIVQRGPHAELVTQEGSVYAGLHASWTAQQAPLDGASSGAPARSSRAD